MLTGISPASLQQLMAQMQAGNLGGAAGAGAADDDDVPELVGDFEKPEEE